MRYEEQKIKKRTSIFFKLLACKNKNLEGEKKGKKEEASWHHCDDVRKVYDLIDHDPTQHNTAHFLFSNKLFPKSQKRGYFLYSPLNLIYI